MSPKHWSHLSFLQAPCQQDCSCLTPRVKIHSHPKMLWANLKPGAHVQEVWHSVVIQQDVNGHRTTPRRFHQVLQDLDICEHVHHNRDHLQGATDSFECFQSNNGCFSNISRGISQCGDRTSQFKLCSSERSSSINQFDMEFGIKSECTCHHSEIHRNRTYQHISK